MDVPVNCSFSHHFTTRTCCQLDLFSTDAVANIKVYIYITARVKKNMITRIPTVDAGLMARADTNLLPIYFQAQQGKTQIDLPCYTQSGRSPVSNQLREWVGLTSFIGGVVCLYCCFITALRHNTSCRWGQMLRKCLKKNCIICNLQDLKSN